MLGMAQQMPLLARPAAGPRRAWLALLGWALLTLSAPLASAMPLGASPNDDGAGVAWASADAVAPAVAPRDPRCADTSLPPVHRLALPLAPAIDATLAARAAHRVPAPVDCDVARWCLARATSTALS